MKDDKEIKDTMVSAKPFRPEEGTEKSRDIDESVREENESAEAMNSDVPQPAGAGKTTEGQPS